MSEIYAPLPGQTPRLAAARARFRSFEWACWPYLSVLGFYDIKVLVLVHTTRLVELGIMILYFLPRQDSSVKINFTILGVAQAPRELYQYSSGLPILSAANTRFPFQPLVLELEKFPTNTEQKLRYTTILTQTNHSYGSHQAWMVHWNLRTSLMTSASLIGLLSPVFKCSSNSMLPAVDCLPWHLCFTAPTSHNLSLLSWEPCQQSHHSTNTNDRYTTSRRVFIPFANNSKPQQLSILDVPVAKDFQKYARTHKSYWSYIFSKQCSKSLIESYDPKP